MNTKKIKEFKEWIDDNARMIEKIANERYSHEGYYKKHYNFDGLDEDGDIELSASDGGDGRLYKKMDLEWIADDFDWEKAIADEKAEREEIKRKEREERKAEKEKKKLERKKAEKTLYERLKKKYGE